MSRTHVKIINGFWYLCSILSFTMGMAAFPYFHFGGIACLACGFICISIPTIRKILIQRQFISGLKKEGLM